MQDVILYFPFRHGSRLIILTSRFAVSHWFFSCPRRDPELMQSRYTERPM